MQAPAIWEALPDVLPGYQKLSEEDVLNKFAQKWGQNFAHGKGLTVSK